MLCTLHLLYKRSLSGSLTTFLSFFFIPCLCMQYTVFPVQLHRKMHLSSRRPRFRHIVYLHINFDASVFSFLIDIYSF
jgi:hypothetical protein